MSLMKLYLFNKTPKPQSLHPEQLDPSEMMACGVWRGWGGVEDPLEGRTGHHVEGDEGEGEAGRGPHAAVHLHPLQHEVQARGEVLLEQVPRRAAPEDTGAALPVGIHSLPRDGSSRHRPGLAWSPLPAQ